MSVIQKRYNTRIRQAISDEYVKCSNERNQISKKCIEIEEKLQNGVNKLTYEQYVFLDKKLNDLQKEYSELTIKINVWEEAREICLNIADEM